MVRLKKERGKKVYYTLVRKVKVLLLFTNELRLSFDYFFSLGMLPPPPLLPFPTHH